MLAVAMLVAAGYAHAQNAPDTEAVENDGVRWFNAEGIPTFKVAEDGTVDWLDILRLPALSCRLPRLSRPGRRGLELCPGAEDLGDAHGLLRLHRRRRERPAKVGAAENQVMPALGTNPNVMCYLDDIYTYLRARGADAVPRGRPAKREDKSEAFAEAEAACMEP